MLERIILGTDWVYAQKSDIFWLNSYLLFKDYGIFKIYFPENIKVYSGTQKDEFNRNTSKRVKKSVFKENILGYYETQGGFPIEIESQISLLITYSLAIFIL